MKRLAVLVAVSLWPALAQAQDLPWLGDVTGVASFLNVRAAPTLSSAVIGELPVGTQGVEVVGLSPDGAWALIPVNGERGGWVARRFLVAQEGPVEQVQCIGTEPFWSLRLGPEGAEWATPEGRFLDPAPERHGSGDLRDLHLRARFEAFSVTATIERLTCSDGMSDRPFGLSVRVQSEGRGLSGCCTLAPAR